MTRRFDFGNIFNEVTRLRGMLAAGQTQGVHLLAAYLLEEGLVMAQVKVTKKENEIPATPRVLQVLDLCGKIVTVGVLFTQRNISMQIIEAGDDYVFREREPTAIAVGHSDLV